MPSGPHIKGRILIVPMDVPSKYRWWDDKATDRLSIHDILVELDADQDMHLKYCGRFEPCSGLKDQV